MQNTNTFSFDFNSKIKLNFDGGEMSTDTGLLLFHEFCETIGIKKLLEEHLPETRIGKFYHQKPEIIYQMLIRIIAGYESNNTAFFLQNDPIFNKIHNSGIASSPTCSRLGKTFGISDLKSLQIVQKKLRNNMYSVDSPKEVVLDIDTTYDPASSSLYGSAYNTHYGETGFSPIVCFDGNTGDMIKGDLRPGNTYCSKKTVTFIIPILKKFKEKNINTVIRGDSGFASPKIYEISEQFEAKYFIKLKSNARLNKVFIKKEEQIEEDEEIFFESTYRAKTWSKERRILCRIQKKGDELFPVRSAIVTNDIEINPKDGFNFYNQRATIENHIEEGKNGFCWDHLSHKYFNQNRVMFQVFLLAQQITNFFRRFCVPIKKSKSSIQTIRILLIKMASKLVKGGRKFLFKCSSSFPFQKLWQETLENIQILSYFIRPSIE